MSQSRDFSSSREHDDQNVGVSNNWWAHVTFSGLRVFLRNRFYFLRLKFSGHGSRDFRIPGRTFQLWLQDSVSSADFLSFPRNHAGKSLKLEADWKIYFEHGLEFHHHLNFEPCSATRMVSLCTNRSMNHHQRNSGIIRK